MRGDNIKSAEDFMMTIKATTKNFNKAINTVGKKAGMNVFERRKLKKTVNNFCYDTGVNVATQLIVSGVEGAALLLGQGVAFTAVTTFNAAKALGTATVNGAKNAATAVKEVSEKKSNKKTKKEAVEELAEELAEELEEAFEDAEQYFTNIGGSE